MESNGRKTFPPRKWYRRVPFLSQKPIETKLTERRRKPDRPSLSDAENGANSSNHDTYDTVTPEARAGFLSLLAFHWLDTLLRTGYSRPLQADDLYDLADSCLAIDHAERLEKAWAAQLEANQKRKPAGRWLAWRPFWARRNSNATVLALALSDVCFKRFWTGGLLRMLGDSTQMLSPLLIGFFIDVLDDPSSHAYRAGFGYAVGLFAILAFSVVTNIHGFYRCATTGILLRAALMHVIYRRATTQLTHEAKLRENLATGKLTSLMSADVSRIDFCCGFFHALWTSYLQIALCLGLTIWTMGYSAVPGFGLLALLYPVQSIMMKTLFRLRRNSMPFTDKRIKAVVEAVSTIRLTKTNAYEKSILAKIHDLRASEVVYIRKRMLLRALNIAVSFTAPTLASVVSILCYAATTGNGMSASVVFSSLTFFLLMRSPLGTLPIAISTVADAQAAVERLSAFLVASDNGTARDAALREALAQKGKDLGAGAPIVQLHDATFWYHDSEQLKAVAEHEEAEEAEKAEKAAAGPGKEVAVVDEKTEKDAKSTQSSRLFIDALDVQRGQLVCIVGPVAAGKSSVFRALLGDMHLAQAQACAVNLDASVSVSPLAYAPQAAWLLSETVRENIVFGRPFDGAWYEDVLTRCCLHADLAMLADGDMTIVGEKGVSLSGGQKQRISLARAVYGRSQLMLLDDCFSALDAHVGSRVFESVVQQARRSKESTIVLVTHSMVFARQADHVVYMNKGRIVEQGSFAELESRGGQFTEYVRSSTVVQSASDATPETSSELEVASEDTAPAKAHAVASASKEAAITAKEEGGEKPSSSSQQTPAEKQKERGKDIMQSEERLVGTVTGKTYLRYLEFGNAWVTVPLFVLSIAVFQGSSVVSALWLSWWQTDNYANISEGGYMGGYAAWGVGQSLGLFAMSTVFAFFCFWCSNHLHAASFAGIMLAPVSFFDTTPQGRITHRFSKDMDAVDNVVGEQLRIFLSTLVQVVGTVIVVSIILPIFLAIAAGVLLVYTWTGMYYRPSARELRRLNNLLRSRIYEHFNESLSGLPTLAAFGLIGGFVAENARRIDTENTAYLLSIACVRWLNLRLDLLGAVLVLGTGLLAIGLRDSINPSTGGLVLSYMVTAQAAFGNMIRFSAEIENNMNSIERLLHYAYNVPQEPAHDVKRIDADLRQQAWPSQGRVQFESLTLSHRPDLDPALRNVSLDIRPGERIGIVGRTGAGKSTLITALLRLAEPSSGRILIDGVDIGTVGLHILRSNISVISQDAVLLAGTIRYNLDPFQEHDDAWLGQCLRMVGLDEQEQEQDGPEKHNADAIINEASDRESSENGKNAAPVLHLDSEVKENGANISHGQRSLISIARALVRKSKIVILDEATASIDGRADRRLQTMLGEVMGSATVLTVAHRLDTVIDSCDRILVMESGAVAELGPPSELYAKAGLFRALCDAANVAVASG
ncbi:hypothetical protein SCUCBS95973_002360 [Sporothrix curviconia]|uniref:ABC multidrug transporter n=1 Tax=Sporothrix curviconia TaxID=1260050 RepID=A0ABP0B695_9PEZI